MKKIVLLLAGFWSLNSLAQAPTAAEVESIIGPPPARWMVIGLGGPETSPSWPGYCKFMGWPIENDYCVLPGGERAKEFQLWRESKSGYTWQKSEEGKAAIARAEESRDLQYAEALADYERRKSVVEAELAARRAVDSPTTPSGQP